MDSGFRPDEEAYETMLNKSRSLSGLALASPTSPFETPWSSPVLGDFYRCSRAGKIPFLSNLKKTSNFPKAPRPARTIQVFEAVKTGIRDCIRCTEEDIIRLRICENPVGYLSAAQHIKLAERFRKRLEGHLTKIEQLEENYNFHQQLWEGVKTMAKAYTSLSGRRSSQQNIDCGLKECVQMLCAIEVSLESLLGTFDCTLRGLFGFARLMPGDVFDIVLRYGHQKWKSRGKIGVTNQSWDPTARKLKAVVGETLNVKATEVKLLGKHVGLGETNCETLNLFSAKPHDLVINLNPSSSLKLGILIKWNPLEGVDEASEMSDISVRVRSSPGRRQAPVRSMIEGDGQLEYWSRVTGSGTSHSDEVRNNRYSVPTFPSSFNALSAGRALTGNGASAGRRLPNPPADRGHENVVGQQTNHKTSEPRSNSIPSVKRYSSGALDRIAEFGARANDEEKEYLAPEDVKVKWQNLQRAMCGSFGTSVYESLQNLKSKIERLPHGKCEELNELEKEVNSIQQLLQKKSESSGHERSLSDVSISVESALEAFSFLESDEFVVESDKQRQNLFGKSHYELISERCTQSPESTAKTTDSGVESIANHLDEFESGLEPSAQTEMPSTGSWQVDVALNWHLQYCGSLLNNIGKASQSDEENVSIEKLKRQTVILSSLSSIARNTDQEPDIHQVLNDLTSSDELKQFWLRCIESHLLVTTTDNFVRQLHHSENLITEKYLMSPKKVFDIIVSHVLDSEASGDAALFEFDIVTLHQFMNFFNRVPKSSIRNFIQDVAEEVQKTTDQIYEVAD